MPAPPRPRSRPSAPPGPSAHAGGALAQPVRRAIDGHAPLADLLSRVRQSQERFAAIRTLLPDALADALRAGPLDDKSWVLLADHAAAAAKLRHCLPRIEEALAAAGWPEPRVVVKVRPRP